MLWEFPLQKIPESAAAERSGRPRGDIRHQPFVAGPILSGDHDAGAHGRVLDQHRFDLAGFDAEAAYLDLMIGAAQELDVGIWQITGQVAGFVETRSEPATERIGNKFFRG